MRARRPSLLRIPRARSLLLAGVLAIVISVAALAAHAYTDLLFFDELGSEDVFWTTLRWKLLAYGAAGAGTAAIVLANLLVAERLSRDTPAKVPRAQRRLAYPVVAVAAGIVAAQWHAPGTWSLLALWSGRTGFGVTDPLFHRDAGFYVFSLPLYQHVVAWLLASLAMAAAASLAAHAVAGGIRRDGRLVVSRGARTHLLLLAALVLLVVSWRYRLDRYSLALPHGGLTGAGFTDAHVRAPARAALAWLAVIAAGIVAGAAAGRLKLRPHRHHARARGPGRRRPRAARAPARALRGPAPEARQGTAVRLRLDRRHAPGLRARPHRRPRLARETSLCRPPTSSRTARRSTTSRCGTRTSCARRSTSSRRSGAITASRARRSTATPSAASPAR